MDNIKQIWKKYEKNTWEEQENFWNQALQQKSHQRNKYQGRPSCKILWTILKMDRGGTRINGSNNKEIDDNPRDDTDFICQENMEEEDSATLKIA